MSLMLFLCLTYQTFGDEVLFASSFTTNDFTTNEGWIFASRHHTDSGIGAYENQNYIGLNTLSGQLYQGEGLTKIFYSLPPHYAIRVKGTMLIKIISFFDYNIGKIIIDGKASVKKSLQIYKQQLTVMQIREKSDFDVFQFHYATSVIIQVMFGQGYKNDDTTLGLRDFYLYVLTCPNGCDSCDNAIVCSDWKLQYRSLINQQFLTFDTEGWYIGFKFNNEDKNSYISLERCQNQNIDILFFGLAQLNQQIAKTIDLPLHYKVKISYFQLLYSVTQLFQYNWMIEVDGSIIMAKTFLVPALLPSHICDYTYDPNYISAEIVENIKFELNHNKQFLNFATYPSDYIFSDQQVRWAIRDFEIYIKPCHNSCAQGCKGPSPQDCQDNVLYNLVLFYSIFTETTFTNNDGWQMIKSNLLSTKRCMDSLVSTDTNFFQGSNYFQKVYQLTQSHTSISISFTLYQIDKFTGEKLFVLVDDVEVKQVSLLAVTIDDGLPLCNVDDDFDKRIIVNITGIAHSQNMLIVQMYTNQIATATGYWGIRNFALTLDKKLVSNEFVNLNLVSNDWKDWIFTPITFQLSLCSSKTLFGGSSQLDQTSSLRKIIKNIPEHQKIKIQFKIVVKAPANKNIQLTFYIDGIQVFLKYLKTNTMLYCDASTNSNFFTIQEIYEHSNSQIFLQISTSNSDNIAYTWGISDFKLSYFQRQISSI